MKESFAFLSLAGVEGEIRTLPIQGMCFYLFCNVPSVRKQTETTTDAGILFVYLDSLEPICSKTCCQMTLCIADAGTGESGLGT